MYIEKTGYHMLYILYTVYFIYREKGREREREGVKAMGGGGGGLQRYYFGSSRLIHPARLNECIIQIRLTPNNIEYNIRNTTCI